MKQSSGMERSTLSSVVQVILCFSASSCSSLPPPTLAVALFNLVRASRTTLWCLALVTCNEEESVHQAVAGLLCT